MAREPEPSLADLRAARARAIDAQLAAEDAEAAGTEPGEIREARRKANARLKYYERLLATAQARNGPR